MTDNINVFLKIKPEIETGITTNTTTLKIISPTSFEEKTYNFKRIVKQNHELQQQCLPIIDEAIKNQQNVCIIGYGQQKSGKSHALGFSLQNEGLLHFLLQRLFDMQYEQITLSMIQLYMQQALDLFNQEKQSSELKIRIKNNEILIENLTEIIASNYQESLNICEEGILKQQNTKLHTVITIKVSKSRISLVEIAGSHSSNRSPEFPSQSHSITSLFRVLSALRNYQTGSQQFIPFRDSHLTMLLKNQLLPPSKIILIGTILPNNSVETNQTIKVIHSCHRTTDIKGRSVTPNKLKSQENTMPKNEIPIQQNQYKELSEYLLKLLTKINSHICKLTNQECLKTIEINQNLDNIIQQVQQVSHQLLSTINSKLSNTTNLIPTKIDGWQKAIKFLYHTYEEEIQREDKLLKEKLLYIINEDEQFDINQLRKNLFPPKQEYTNSIYKTLITLRKYTNSIQIPYQKENFRTKLINDKEYASGGIQSNGPKIELTSFQSYTDNLMSKFKWQSTQKQDEFEVVQQ